MHPSRRCLVPGECRSSWGTLASVWCRGVVQLGRFASLKPSGLVVSQCFSLTTTSHPSRLCSMSHSSSSNGLFLALTPHLWSFWLRCPCLWWRDMLRLLGG